MLATKGATPGVDGAGAGIGLGEGLGEGGICGGKSRYTVTGDDTGPSLFVKLNTRARSSLAPTVRLVSIVKPPAAHCPTPLKRLFRYSSTYAESAGQVPMTWIVSVVTRS